MENVILVILLILALGLIGVVLLQRSEGGGLGIGGGGGVMSARGAATALTKVTWALGIGFMATALILTILSARNSADQSVVDALGDEPPAAETTLPGGLTLDEMLPPTSDEPLAPPRAD